MMKVNKIIVLGMMALGFSLMGCSKKQNVNPDTGSSAVDGAGDVSESDISSGVSDSDSGNAMGIQTIRFPFDSFEIVGENREILKQNIALLKSNPTVSVQVEGHCDERGGIQYNLALGEKRANAVRQQLIAGGVAGSRITTISMGKEKPVAMGSDEASWSQNRRANFVITGK